MYCTWTKGKHDLGGQNSDGRVARELISHQCDPGLIPQFQPSMYMYQKWLKRLVGVFFLSGSVDVSLH